jgi:hypothetical protein
MRTYARIQDGRVVELVATSSDISTMFHPALTWVDASSVTGIAEGWTYDGSVFSRTVVPEVVAPVLSISGMQAQLAILAAQLATLTKTV